MNITNPHAHKAGAIINREPSFWKKKKKGIYSHGLRALLPALGTRRGQLWIIKASRSLYSFINTWNCTTPWPGIGRSSSTWGPITLLEQWAGFPSTFFPYFLFLSLSLSLSFLFLFLFFFFHIMGHPSVWFHQSRDSI